MSSSFLSRLGLVVGLTAGACSLPAADLSGHWALVPDRSTNLASWQTYDLSIEQTGTKITISRHVASEGRETVSVIPVDTAVSDNAVSVPWWIDNRHIGAYSGGDKIAHIKARWLDAGRVLRTDADLTLNSQQGDHPVNILTDYRISTDGKTLTVLELRSTRDLPIVYVFHRQ